MNIDEHNKHLRLRISEAIKKMTPSERKKFKIFIKNKIKNVTS